MDDPMKLVIPVGVGLLTALEIHALRGDHPERTLSRWVRLIFQTDTHAGRIVFASSWVALSAWFMPHIVLGPHDRKEI